MQFPISFLLAFATVSLAVPSVTIRDKTTLHTGHSPGTSGLTRGNLALPSRVRQSGDDVPTIYAVTDDGFTPASSGEGLTFDSCVSQDECTDPRLCLPSVPGQTAYCAPLPLVSCTSTDDCDDGETCADAGQDVVCVSDAVVQVNLRDADADSDEEATKQGEEDTIASAGEGDTIASAGEGDSGSASSAGVTGDPCQASANCAGSRICLDVPNGGLCDGGDQCRCIPTTSLAMCDDDSDCDEGEACFDIDEIQDVLEDITGIDLPSIPSDAVEFKLCISRAAREDAVCIASHSLGHISREELVFEKDTIAHVLCDLNGSCATPGHMVRYKGRGMMMKSYCQLTSCVRKVMKVNSPRYRRGLTVPSHSDDLVFTALAARFQSRAEEGVLSAAVRIGL